MRIGITLFSTLKKYLPKIADGNFFEIEIKKGSSLVDVINQIGIELEKTKIFFLNNAKVSIYDPIELKHGDKITIFPPMAGG